LLLPETVNTTGVVIRLSQERTLDVAAL
jgi:hypothetical protein